MKIQAGLKEKLHFQIQKFCNLKYSEAYEKDAKCIASTDLPRKRMGPYDLSTDTTR